MDEPLLRADDPAPPPPAEEDKPFWEHSGFRALVGSVYGIWLPFLYTWLVSVMGAEKALATLATVSLALSFAGINVVTRQAEARGRRQMARRR